MISNEYVYIFMPTT